MIDDVHDDDDIDDDIYDDDDGDEGYNYEIKKMKVGFCHGATKQQKQAESRLKSGDCLSSAPRLKEQYSTAINTKQIQKEKWGAR